jgi:hypothetical protein
MQGTTPAPAWRVWGKNMKALSQGSRAPDRDMNTRPPENEAQEIAIRP